MRMAACLLLGMCMLLSVVAKASSHSYLNSSFFHFTLITDPRFSAFTATMTDLDAMALEKNRSQVRDLQLEYLDGDGDGARKLKSSEKVYSLAWVMTWWTVGIELALAILFLLSGNRLEILRSLILLAFSLTTYSVATVQGFGWLL